MASSTVYDDVFRTLLNDCQSLIIPLVNEVFGENYSGSELIEFKPNEHFMQQQGGDEDKRITDTFFVIHGPLLKGCHLECQSTNDGTLIVRMFEYDSQIALDYGTIQGNVLHVKFPNSGILFLRSNSNTPDFMTVNVEFPDGSFSYDVPSMKVQRYSLEEIFNKRLLFLIPFYIFPHEKNFNEYDEDGQKLNSLPDEYKIIAGKLDRLVIDGAIDEYTRCTIQDMTGRVTELIAKDHSPVKDGVKNIMAGKILDHPAKDILKQGIAQGISQGIAEGRLNMLFELVTKKLLSLKDASAAANLSEDDFSRMMAAAN